MKGRRNRLFLFLTTVMYSPRTELELVLAGYTTKYKSGQ